MVSILKPYTVYKSSGVEWLGDVPAHWELQRGKTIFQLVDIRSKSGTEELLAVSSEKGIVPRSSINVTMFKAESYVGYKLCWPGDLVINSLWSWAQGLGVSKYHGIISSAYGVYRLLPKIGIYPQYIHNLVRSFPFQWELQVRSKGIWISRLQLTDEAFLAAPFPFPPHHEQEAIVRYLDYVDGRINRYISARKKLVKLLEEQKQALIHRAVTRGLDPNVRLEPSGVEWLGDVPAHWEIKPLKHWIGVNEAVLTEKTDPYYEFQYLEISSVGTNILTEEPKKIRFATAPSRARRIVRNGDIIISTVRTYLKAVWFASETNGDLICSTGFTVLTPRLGTVPKFVSYLVQSNSFTDQITAESVGIAYPAISEGCLGALRVPIPSFPEQKAIAEYLDNATTNIDSAISRTRRQIELLSEYRTRLIADVVTGKLDVRETTANLPNELRSATSKIRTGSKSTIFVSSKTRLSETGREGQL